MAETRRRNPGRCAVSAGVGLLVAAATAAVVAGGSAVAAAGPAGCSALARVESQWGAGSGGGQILTVTVTNTASVSAARWTASWTLAAGQSVTSAWSATVTTSGTTATAGNMPYNGTLAPGGSTRFGVQLSGVAPAPVVECVNDASVSVSPGPGPSDGAEIPLTEADNNRTLTLLVGQSVRVSLGSDFRPTTASGPALVLVATSGGYATGQPLVEVYRVRDVGPADLSTITDYACLHAVPRPCALPQLLWRVHVDVVGIGG